MRVRCLALCLAAVCAAAAQDYSGPQPPQTDLPYLKHAENLVPTEVLEAKEEKGKKDDFTYVIAGRPPAPARRWRRPCSCCEPTSCRSTSWRRETAAARSLSPR